MASVYADDQWALADCHAGQFTETYARLCKVSTHYRPSASECGPTSYEAQIVYEAACERLLSS